MMRRDLSTVLDELRDGLVHSATRAGMRLTGVEMTLPMDLLVVLRDGGVALLADVPRSRADDPWRDAQGTRLHIRWQALPTGDAP
jgi:hypothetical protein